MGNDLKEQVKEVLFELLPELAPNIKSKLCGCGETVFCVNKGTLTTRKCKIDICSCV